MQQHWHQLGLHVSIGTLSKNAKKLVLEKKLLLFPLKNEKKKKQDWYQLGLQVSHEGSFKKFLKDSTFHSYYVGVCNNIDINLLCTRVYTTLSFNITVKMTKMNIRESVDGTHSCRCRRDMAWNSRTLECQVSLIIFIILPSLVGRLVGCRVKQLHHSFWRRNISESFVWNHAKHMVQFLPSRQKDQKIFTDVSGHRLQGLEVHLCAH